MTTRRFASQLLRKTTRIGWLLTILSMTFAAFAQTPRLPAGVIDEIAQTVVMIVVEEDGEPISSGSGTLVTAEGMIFTNRHVISNGDDYAIYMIEDINEPTVLSYYASVVTFSRQLDFAVLQIDRNARGRAIDTDDLDLPHQPIESLTPSVTPTRGDDLFVFGYPGISEDYLAFVHGNISTIQNGDVAGERRPVWYQTDAEIAPGNSGGLAVNLEGEPVGIPTGVNVDDETGGRLGGVLPFSAILALVDAGQIDISEGGIGSRQPGRPSGSPPVSVPGADSVNIACSLNDAEIVNGTSVTIVQMRPGFSYTVTALGIGNFDPVLVVSTESGRTTACNDDSDTTRSYTVTLPGVGTVRGNNNSAQVTFQQPINDLADMHINIGGFGGMSGEFLLIIQGMGVTDADGGGDPFRFLMTDRVAASNLPVTAYMIGVNQSLDPMLDTADSDFENYLDDVFSNPIYCDDAGDDDLCWGDSDSLESASINYSGGSIDGDLFDAMIAIDPYDILANNMESMLFLATSYEVSTYGQYALVFHVGLE